MAEVASRIHWDRGGVRESQAREEEGLRGALPLSGAITDRICSLWWPGREVVVKLRSLRTGRDDTSS